MTNREFQKLLLEYFRENIQDLITAFKISRKQSTAFTFLPTPLRERESGVLKFCHQIEQIFFHGVKKRKHEKFLGQGAFWDFVKNSTLPSLADGIAIIEKLGNARSSFPPLALLRRPH